MLSLSISRNQGIRPTGCHTQFFSSPTRNQHNTLWSLSKQFDCQRASLKVKPTPQFSLEEKFLLPQADGFQFTVVSIDASLPINSFYPFSRLSTQQVDGSDYHGFSKRKAKNSVAPGSGLKRERAKEEKLSLVKFGDEASPQVLNISQGRAGCHLDLFCNRQNCDFDHGSNSSGLGTTKQAEAAKLVSIFQSLMIDEN
ncbi:hypothetical protein DSO57_1019360 [Entomophthora muscae]|uniref:Uncharacterized protein n=1 Tax=Entomophthora muscae TaxID=34485 RepID=A0ACC2U1T0_9FUNG|nr:hypothetical protein DSO57_1019360 [Entomophthora muscae]